MAGGGDIEVSAASEAERRLIAGLLQFYVYDFSEMAPPDSEAFAVTAEGLFPPYPFLEGYWGDRSRIPLIIRRRGRPAGFALINGHAHSGLPAARNMAEFFVMRQFRRLGVARAAVCDILTRYPGAWEIAIAQRNTAARAFWPAAVAATPGVRGLTTLAGDGVRWTGPILRFTVGT